MVWRRPKCFSESVNVSKVLTVRGTRIRDGDIVHVRGVRYFVHGGAEIDGHLHLVAQPLAISSRVASATSCWAPSGGPQFVPLQGGIADITAFVVPAGGWKLPPC